MKTECSQALCKYTEEGFCPARSPLQGMTQIPGLALMSFALGHTALLLTCFLVLPRSAAGSALKPPIGKSTSGRPSARHPGNVPGLGP